MIHADPVCAEPKLFVGGLSFEISREEVQAHFQQYGPLKNVALLKHQDTGKPKGCAMVLFTKWAHAEAAVEAENGTSSPLSAPRQLIVKFADPQRRQEDGVVVGVTPKKLFVGQVAKGVSAEQIRGIFAPYGEILDLNVMPPKKDAGMGCAFVTFSTWASAEAAMEGVDGKFTLPGAQNPIAVKMADAKPTDIQRVGGKRGMADMMAGAGGAMAAGGAAKRQQFMAGMGMAGMMGGMGYGMGGMMGGMGMPGMAGMAGMGMPGIMGMPGMMGMGYGGMGGMMGGGMMGGGMQQGFGVGMPGAGGQGMMGAGGQRGGAAGGEATGFGADAGAPAGGMPNSGGMQQQQPQQQLQQQQHQQHQQQASGSMAGAMPGGGTQMGSGGQLGGAGLQLGGAGQQLGVGGQLSGGGEMVSGQMGGGQMMGAGGQMMAAGGQMMGAGGQMVGGGEGGQQVMGGGAQMGAGMGAGMGGGGAMQGGMMGGMPGMGMMAGGMMPVMMAGGMMGGGMGMMPGMMGMMPGMMGGGGAMGAAAGGGAGSAALAAAKAWKLFLGQVSYTLTEADLFPFFSQFGNVLELVLLRMPDGRSRGCGFIIYSTQAEAELAMANANGAVLPTDARARPITVKYANSRT
ncbi:HNRNPA1 [Scenedesmus sp. PABB004]|nr:HNRNPA1 [Scenedesmus sp. PABB004]